MGDADAVGDDADPYAGLRRLPPETRRCGVDGCDHELAPEDVYGACPACGVSVDERAAARRGGETVADADDDGGDGDV